MAVYLVTGGAGFIGSHIVDELVKRNHEVRVIDDLSEGKLSNLEDSLPKIKFYKGDIRDEKLMNEIIDGVDYVIHEAAVRSVPKSIDYPLLTNDVNITATLLLLELSKKYNVKKVIIASSSSVYGNSEKLPLSENDKPNPISPYAITKLVNEYYAKVYAEIYGLNTVSLRYFNVYGPRQDPASEYAAVVARFILRALRDEELEIHGDGLQSRDFTFIEDVVEGTLLCIEKNVPPGTVLNIAGGKNHTVLDVANTISKILNKKLKMKHTPPRKGDPRHTLADTKLQKEILNFVPHIDFYEGIKRTIKYFEENYKTT